MILSKEALDIYLSPLTGAQNESIQTIRALLLECAPGLSERIEDGKWLTGLLVYAPAESGFAFALGPLSGGKTTFHMMPYYGSKALQERHGPALRHFLSGKSCIKFLHASDLPLDALSDIVRNGVRASVGEAGEHG